MIKMLQEDSSALDSTTISDIESNAEIDCIQTKSLIDTNKEHKTISSKSPKEIINEFLRKYFDAFGNNSNYSAVSLCNILMNEIYYSTIVRDLLQQSLIEFFQLCHRKQVFNCHSKSPTIVESNIMFIRILHMETTL